MTNVQHEAENRSIAQLEEEGDIAADYIEELLDICDLDGDIDIDARNGRAYVSVNAGETANLRLLSKPETVSALQELTRLAVQTKTGAFSRSGISRRRDTTSYPQPSLRPTSMISACGGSIAIDVSASSRVKAEWTLKPSCVRRGPRAA